MLLQDLSKSSPGQIGHGESGDLGTLITHADFTLARRKIAAVSPEDTMSQILERISLKLEHLEGLILKHTRYQFNLREVFQRAQFLYARTLGLPTLLATQCNTISKNWVPPENDGVFETIGPYGIQYTFLSSKPELSLFDRFKRHNLFHSPIVLIDKEILEALESISIHGDEHTETSVSTALLFIQNAFDLGGHDFLHHFISSKSMLASSVDIVPAYAPVKKSADFVNLSKGIFIESFKRFGPSRLWLEDYTSFLHEAIWDSIRNEHPEIVESISDEMTYYLKSLLQIKTKLGELYSPHKVNMIIGYLVVIPFTALNVCVKLDSDSQFLKPDFYKHLKDLDVRFNSDYSLTKAISPYSRFCLFPVDDFEQTTNWVMLQEDNLAELFRNVGFKSFHDLSDGDKEDLRSITLSDLAELINVQLLI